MFRRLTTIALAGGLCCVLAPAAQADLEAPEQLSLDTYRTPNVGFAGPVATTASLTFDRAYVVTVRGTFGAFWAHQWDPAQNPGWTVCGTPEGAPMFPSPGRPTAPAGQDAEVFFARPWEQPCPTQLPRTYSGLHVNVGNGWFHTAPNGGPYTAPRADHTYSYLVAGGGQQVSSRQVDSQTTDNTGIYRITVRPAEQSDCTPSCPGTVIPPAPGAVSVTGTSNSTSSSSSSSRRCLSRRKVRIRVVTHRRNPVRYASVVFNGKRLRVRRMRIEGRIRHTALLDFTGIRKSTVTVRLRARLRNGRVVTGKRVYRTCDRKLRGGTPKL